MRFKELIKHLDFLMKVKIFTDDVPDEPAWSGTVIDIPWVYLDMVLDTDENGEAISVYYKTKNKNEEGIIEPYMTICLKEVKL